MPRTTTAEPNITDPNFLDPRPLCVVVGWVKGSPPRTVLDVSGWPEIALRGAVDGHRIVPVTEAAIRLVWPLLYREPMAPAPAPEPPAPKAMCDHLVAEGFQRRAALCSLTRDHVGPCQSRQQLETARAEAGIRAAYGVA
jgi:hypothetical protein